MSKMNFHQLGPLVQFIVRRDRLRIAIWSISILFFTFIIPPSLEAIYPTQEERDAIAVTMDNPAIIAMLGPADVSNYTVGTMTSHQMLLFTAIVVALMSIFLVVRHTREEEESGRAELIRSLPVGRLAHLNATLLVYTLVYILLALAVGIGMTALQMETLDLQGSMVYGAALGGTGMFFAGLTAIFSQISGSARGSIGLSIGALLLFYIIRGIGDISVAAWSWLSPFGLVTKTAAYGENNWLPIILLVAVSILFFVFANYLHAIRDIGSGMIAAKPGKVHASPFLKNTFGLTFRLQRTGIIAWAVGMFVLGVSYGSVLGDLDAYFEGNELIQQMLPLGEGSTYTEQFLPMLVMVMALIGTIPPLMVINKLYSEEKQGRTEHLLGRAVSRIELIGSYVILAVMNGVLMFLLAGIGVWIAGTAVLDESFELGTILSSMFVYYPALLLMVGLAVLLVGYAPKFFSVLWGYMFYSFIVLYLGGLFQLGEWVAQLSPFGHVPQIPMEEMNWLSIMLLTIIALALTVVGIISYRKRDIL